MTEIIADSSAQMWLINTSTCELHEFTTFIPPYATLSYVTDENDASFEDLIQETRDSSKESINMIPKACGQARTLGSEWLWSHATCVDKRSCAALSEAINSLAQIYCNCEYNIIYLKDLGCAPTEDEGFGEGLAECRWMKNIWAIPQIIFPRVAYFYSSGWSRIGTKASMLAQFSVMTGIDQPVLEDSDCLEDYSIARRMSWASEMNAPRIEDYAYALLGLFDVSMPIIYGEGRKAFARLQEEIMRDTDDFSLLAWEDLDAQEYNGLFAHSPACFRRFRNGPMTPLHFIGEAQIHCAGVTMQTSFWETQTSLFLPLEGQDGTTCSIPITQWNGHFVRRGSRVEWDLPESVILDSRRICLRRNVSARTSKKISAYERFVREGLQRSSEAADDNVAARASRCSVMGLNSNDGTGTMALSAEDCGMTSQYAPSVSLSKVISQEDLITWSAHGIGSVDGRVSALDSDLRPPWVHKTTSEAHDRHGDYFVDDAEEAGSCSACNGSAAKEVNDEPQDSMEMDESPSNGYQVLDVAQFTKELADIAAEQFLSACQKQSNKRTFAPWQRQNRKRPKLMQSSDQLEAIHTSDSDDGEIVLVKKARFFACPFYVWNNKYIECVTRHHLHSIEDVRDHVCWEHRRPIFCPVCKEEFSSGKDRDAHIRLRTCHANISTIPEGVTDEQDEQLNKNEQSSLSDESWWFQIWDIIFPDVERPSTAFYNGGREAGVSAFRQFWMQSGEEVVADFLEKKECQSYSIQNEERKLKAIYDLVVEKVVDRIFFDLSDFTGTG